MPADTGVVEKGAHVGRMREGLPPVSPFLARPPQDLFSVEGELTRIESQRAALESLHGWEAVERTKFALLEQQGELEVAMAYFGGHIDSLTGKRVATINEETDKRLARSRKKDRLKVKTVFEVDGEEITDLLLARKKIAEQVLLERIEVVLQARDEVDPGGNLSSAEFAAISDPKDKGKLYAAELIPQAIHPFVVAREMGVGEETYGAVAEFDSMKDEVANLDASAARDKIKKAAKLLPEAATISTLWATEIGRIYGKAPSSPGWQSATYLAKAGAEAAVRVVNAGTGKRPTDVPYALEGPDPRDPSKSVAIDLTGMATRALDGARSRRADRIMDNYAGEAERRISSQYQSDTVTSERFSETVGKALAGEKSLQEEIKEQGLGVAGRMNEEHWHSLLPWREWAREGLPTMQGGVVVFQEQSTEGARVTGLIPTPEAFRAVLEDRGVREAIVRLYPLVREGRLAFGANYAVYGSEDPAQDDKDMKLLDSLSGPEKAALGITGSPEETIAFEVLRTLFVHPEPEFSKAWGIQKGPFDSLRRWYFAEKWSHFAGNFALVMLRVNKVGGSTLGEWREWFEKNPGKKIEDAPRKLRSQLLRLGVPIDRLYGIGDAWELANLARAKDGLGPRDISELLTDWDSVRTDGAVVELGRFYDSAKKATETANALEALFKAGVTPDNVYKFLYESEKFKHLSVEERGEILKAFYEEGYDNLLKDLQLEMKLKEGLDPGRRAKVVEQIDGLVGKGLMSKEQAAGLKAEVSGMRERGEGFRLRERTYRYLHHYPNLLTLATSLVGGVLSKLGLEEVGQPLSFWGRKIAGWSFYGAVVGGGAFLALNTWNLMAEVPVHLALGRAFLQTFVTAAWPAQWTIGGLLSSSGLWISAATWGIALAGRALRRISIGYDDYHRQSEAISAAKKNK